MSSEMNIKVFSYNIHKGFSSGNFKFTLAKIKQAIRDLSADIVLLQEVQGRHDGHSKKFSEWPTVSQFEYLADELWPHYAYGQNAVYTEGHHGNAILSKFPIESWENFDVSTNRYERRGILHAKLLVPDSEKKIDCFTLHFNMLNGGRTRQVKHLCDLIQSRVDTESSMIVGGDFNDWSAKISAVLKKDLSMEEAFEVLSGEPARTYPSRLPVMCLDRIYFRNFKVLNASVQKGTSWSKLSDHLGLLAEFQI